MRGQYFQKELMTVQSGLQGGFVGQCFLMFADDQLLSWETF